MLVQNTTNSGLTKSDNYLRYGHFLLLLLSLCLSSICLSVCLSSFCLCVCLCVFLSVCLSLSVRLSVCLQNTCGASSLPRLVKPQRDLSSSFCGRILQELSLPTFTRVLFSVHALHYTVDFNDCG